MAKIRRIIRKLETPHDAALDEQLWPVNLALVVLGAFSLGATLAYLRFDDPRWWANAKLYLFAIPIVVAGAMVALRFINSRGFRRSMQLAIVLSAIAHLVLIVLSAESVIFSALSLEAKPKTNPSDRRTPENAVQLSADLLTPEDDDRPRDFERPVETATPEVAPEQVEKQDEPEQTSPRTPQPVPVPEPQRTDQPAVVKRPTTEQAAPREADTASKLSRNSTTRNLAPAAAKVEAVATEQRPTAERLDATASKVARQTAVEKPLERTQQPPSDAPARPDLAIARRTDATTPRAETSATAALKRQVNQPVLTPKSQVDASDAPSIARRTSETQPTPAAITTTRRTAAPATERPTQEPTTEPSTQVAATNSKRELDARPDANIAAAPTAVASRQPRVTTRPSTVVEAPPSPSSATETRGAEVTAQSTGAARWSAPTATANRSTAEAVAASNPTVSATSPTRAATAARPSPDQVATGGSTAARADRASLPNVVTRAAEVEATTGRTPSATLTPSDASSVASRQTSGNSASATRTQPSLEAPSSGAGTPLAGGGLTRSTSPSSPSLNATAAPGATPQRASRVADLAGSPTSAEAPSPATGAASANEPSAEPARLALSRSESGVAGTGNSPNLDRGTAAADSPALVASAAARRSHATTAGPPDAALTPSTLATRAHSRAGAASPTASMSAQTLAGSEGGAPSSAQDFASSSAALTRAAGSAAAGEVSAARGSAEIDVGANTIVGESGRGRAAGGGQPELSFDPQMGSVARKASSGSAASIATDRVAAVAEAPLGSGGESTSLDPSQTLAVRGNTASGAAGGPSRADEKGPLSEPSASSLVAESPGSRTDAAAGGDPESEDEKERQRRLARAQAAAVAGTGPTSDKVTDAPMVAGESAGGATETGPASTATGRLAQASEAASAAGTSQGAEAPASGESPGAAAVARAEVAAGTMAASALPGGGTAAASKSATGQQIRAAAEADQIQLAGATTSGGGPDGVPLQAQGIDAAKTSGGAASQITEGAIGAKAGDEVVDAFGPQGAGNVAGGARSASPGADDGPSLSDVAQSGGPQRRTSEAGVAGGGEKVEVPLVGPTSAVAQADLDHGIATGIGRAASDAGDGLQVQIDAPEGVGGLGEVLAADVGINSRLARNDSLEIGPTPTRFVGRRSGGIPGVSTASVVPTESFKRRAEGRAGRGSLPPQTEAAVEAGLAFLSRHQQADGSWRLQGFETSSRADPQMVSDTAATALAVLAFQGAGYNHREHKYAAVVRGGLDYLLQNQKDDGDLFVPLDDESNRSVWLYSHALASLALCEAYGMTQDPALKEPAQKSIDFIVAGQNRERGGWRYAPGIGSDTSVTGAMLVALRSAELAGLNVPKHTYDNVSRWLDQAQASPTQAHLYRYNPNAPDTESQRHGRAASPTMTSLGLLMRLYLGWRRDNPNMVQGANYLKQHLPAVGTATAPQRDTYYWYYATQVMFHMGGDHWKQWNERLHRLLVDSQIKEGAYAGSWNPRLPVPDRWGPHGGRLYVTALNLLSLEVQYRHLPTYEDTAK
jgi:hypothetical protein